MNVHPSILVRLLATLLVLAGAATLRAEPSTRPVAQAVAHIAVTVSDMGRAVSFYTDILDFKKLSDGEHHGDELERFTGVFGARTRHVHLQLGNERIELIEYLTSPGRPIPADSRSNDGWFQHIAIITSDMDAAYQRLRRHKVRHASTAPQRLPDWNPAAGGIKAFYFHDPDGHVLEILQFPPGKGDPRWQSRESLFLGIDHTAIVVEDTDRSLGFYRDVLGLKVAGTSENHGIEQERLNNVFGARLRITTLRARSGPAIELLEYLAPRTGRPYPADARPNDVLHWHVALDVPDVNDAWTVVRRLRAPLVSSAPARLFLIRDPDGHALSLGGK